MEFSFSSSPSATTTRPIHQWSLSPPHYPSPISLVLPRYHINFLPPPPPLQDPPLVLARRLLARLQLIQIPPADGQRALVLVHAPPEVANVGGAGAGAVVLLRRVVVGRHARLLGVGGRRRLGGAAAAEEAADGVADGGADGDTTDEELAFLLSLRAHALGEGSGAASVRPLFAFFGPPR